MNELYPIHDAPFCDNCGQLSYNQVQSTEGDWLCPDCAEQHTCYICGAVTLESELRVFDGTLVKLCPDCAHDVMKENAACGKYDLTPVHDLMHNAINRLNQLR